MKTDQPNQSAAVFLQTASTAVAQLKERLQQDYQQAYPDLGQLIHIVLEEEEARAWDLTLFPHLVLPDLVETHLASLNMHSTKTNQGDVFAAHDFNAHQAYEPAVIFCG